MEFLGAALGISICLTSLTLSLIGFKLLTENDFMLKVTVTFTFDFLAPQSIGIIYGPWPTKTTLWCI